MTTHDDVMISRQLAGRVVRYHTWPMIRKPTVAEHECRVAKIYCELWGLPRAEVLYYCLHHDDGELAAGDTPFYAKRAVPGLAEKVNEAERMGLTTLGVSLPEITEEEFLKFKVSDCLEMWECAHVELTMGNGYAQAIIDNLRPTVHRLAYELAESVKVENWIRRIS